jgi:hypothetical protein
MGYSKRFGLVYVDFETLERVPKASFEWYRERISADRPHTGGEERPLATHAGRLGPARPKGART